MDIITHGLKSILKLFMPEKHRVFIRWYYAHYGALLTVLEYSKLLIKLPFIDVLTIQVDVPESQTKVSLRPFDPDMITFDNIFLDSYYEIDCPNAKYIIDAGANVGIASIFFAIRYPEAKILSIEPDDSNYKLLVSNTANFPNIQTIKAALWGNNRTLSIENKEAESWEYRVQDSSKSGEINGITVEDAMTRLYASYIDILKISITGAEVEVFQSSGSWIDKMKFIIVKLYDWTRPGCTEAMEDAIQGRNFIMTEREYNILLSNQIANQEEV